MTTVILKKLATIAFKKKKKKNTLSSLMHQMMEYSFPVDQAPWIAPEFRFPHTQTHARANTHTSTQTQ